MNIKNMFVNEIKVGDKTIPSKWMQIKKLVLMIFIGLVVATLGSYFIQGMIYLMSDKVVTAYTEGFTPQSFK